MLKWNCTYSVYCRFRVRGDDIVQIRKLRSVALITAFSVLVSVFSFFPSAFDSGINPESVTDDMAETILSEISSHQEAAKNTPSACDMPMVGTAYYVDPSSGNDNNPGTSPGEAWATLARASANVFMPGDRILLRRGLTFSGPFTARGNGERTHPVIVSAYGEGELPVIDGGGDRPMLISGVTGWYIENLRFTAPDGYGLFIQATEYTDCKHITVAHCVFNDIYGKDNLMKGNVSRAAMTIHGSSGAGRVRNLHIFDCDFSDCAYGIHMNGISRENYSSEYESPEKSYNSDFIIESCRFTDTYYGAVIVASLRSSVIRYCTIRNCAKSALFACAPLWMHHADDITVEYCEISGSKNFIDGMAIDFDGWTTNSTYQYIYSHDNTRFIRNCCYDSDTRNSGNTVRCCLSVNDNTCSNRMATRLISFRAASFSSMYDFSFTNNTIVNGSAFAFGGLKNSTVENNVFESSNNPLNMGLSLIFSLFSVQFTGSCVRNAFSKVVLPVVSRDNIKSGGELSGMNYEILCGSIAKSDVTIPELEGRPEETPDSLVDSDEIIPTPVS